MKNKVTLKEARRQKRMPQIELGKLVGLSQASISLIENGWSRPSIKQIRKMEEILEIKKGSIKYGQELKELCVGVCMGKGIIKLK